jgi:hypothetical protein
MKDETIHVILGWRCQTKDCGQFHFAKYLGEKSKIAEGSRMPLKAKGRIFSIYCPKCQQSHDYDPKNLRYMELPKAPTAGVQDKL